MTTNRHVRHLVIGAGFAGLGAAIKLEEAGETADLAAAQPLAEHEHAADDREYGRP